jgi:hypothetical protein
MSKICIGIDNGVTGAMAALDSDGAIIYLAPLPTTVVGKWTQLDSGVFRTQLSGLIKDQLAHILVEPAQMFTPGKKALASTWFCYGALTATLAGYPWEPINPQRWQRVMFADHVRAVDQKAEGGQRKKSASIIVAQRLFPRAILTRTPKSKVPDSGICDALLIAAYARRTR